MLDLEPEDPERVFGIPGLTALRTGVGLTDGK